MKNEIIDFGVWYNGGKTKDGKEWKEGKESKESKEQSKDGSKDSSKDGSDVGHRGVLTSPVEGAFNF